MLLFYTDIIVNESLVKDVEGEEFTDLAAAQTSAIQSALALVAARLVAGAEGDNLEMHVCDEDHIRLATLVMAGAVTSRWLSPDEQKASVLKLDSKAARADSDQYASYPAAAK